MLGVFLMLRCIWGILLSGKVVVVLWCRKDRYVENIDS